MPHEHHLAASELQMLWQILFLVEHYEQRRRYCTYVLEVVEGAIAVEMMWSLVVVRCAAMKSSRGGCARGTKNQN